MPREITVTKAATAYTETEKDTPVSINADFILDLIPAPADKEIGSAVLYFLDGSTMNVQETLKQIMEQVKEKRKHYFQQAFSKN